MPRKRVQNPKVRRDGSFWRIRYTEDVRQPDGSIKTVRLSQAVGIADGPGAIKVTEAKKDALEFMAKVNQRASVPQCGMTLRQFVVQKFEPEVVWPMKHSGKKHYKYCFKAILETLGEVPLKDLTVDVIGGFIRGQRQADGSEYSTQTLSHLKNALSAIIQYAKEVGYFSGDNPARMIRLPAMESRQKPALTFEQAQIVLANLHDPYQTMALMSMSTSLNVAELCGLRWKRVNLTDTKILTEGYGNNTIALPPRSFAIVENYYEGHYGSVKGSFRKNASARNRIQPLPVAVYDALVRIYNGTAYKGPDDPVFASATGRPVDAHNATNRILKNAGRAAGIPSLSWHSFRRTASTLTHWLGMDRADRVALMGHTKEAMTELYNDSDIERRRTYVDELAAKVTPRKAEVIPFPKVS
jgi:integrase